MINLPEAVYSSALWVLEAHVSSPWYCYFDWKTQFHLSKNQHPQVCAESGYSLYLGSENFGERKILLIDFKKFTKEDFQRVWKSLGEPKTSFFWGGRLPTENYTFLPEFQTISEVP